MVSPVAIVDFLVGNVDNNGVICDAHFVQCFQQLADIVVDSGSATHVVADKLLVCGFSGSGPLHAFGAEWQSGITAPPFVGVLRGNAPAAFQFFECLADERTPVGFRPPVENVFRLGEGDTVVEVLHAYRIIVRLVGRLEVAAHHERLLAVLLFDPLDGFFCHQIGREAQYPFAETPVARPGIGALDECRIAVFALVEEDRVIVKPLRLRLDMPFADQSGVVSVGLQGGCPGRVWRWPACHPSE